MAADAKIIVEFVADDKSMKRAVKSFKGSLKNIARDLKKMDMGKLPKELGITRRELILLGKEIKRNENNFRRMGNVGIMQFKRLTKNIKQIRTAQGRAFFGEGGKRTAGAKTTLRRSRQQQKQMMETAKQLSKMFSPQNRKALTAYNRSLTAFNNKMREVRDLVGASSRALATLNTQMGKRNLGRGMAGGRGAGGGAGGVGGAGGGNKRQLGRQMFSYFSGAVGFTAIEIGNQIEQMFSSKRLQGKVSGAVGGLMEVIGSVFGTSISQIFTDVGTAFGTLGELLINIITFQVRFVGVAIGGALKGLGYAIASGIIASIGGGFALTFWPVAGILILGLFVTLLHAITSIISELVDEIMDILGKALTIITSLISAGLRVVVVIIRGIGKAILTIWKGIWTSFVAIAKLSLASIKEILSTLTKEFVKFGLSSVEAFAKAELGATKAAKEIVDVAGNKVLEFMDMISKARMQFGFGETETQQAMFNIVSAGYRDIAKAQEILHASSRLAIADQADLATATNALITVFQNYEKHLYSVERVSKLLTAATTLGLMEINELGPSLKSVIGIASLYGIRLEDVLASIAMMTRTFGKGSVQSATRYLSRFIEAVKDPTSGARKEFDRLGISITEISDMDFGKGFLEFLKQLGKLDPTGIRAMFPTMQARRAFASLSQGAEQFEGILEDIQGVMEAQGEQMKLNMNTLIVFMNRLGAVISTVKQKFGKFISDTLLGVAFSKRMMKIWMKIGDIITSRRFNKALENMVRIFSKALLPMKKFALILGRQIVDIFRLITRGQLFDPEDSKTFLKNIGIIFALTSKWLTEIVTLDNMIATVNLAFGTTVNLLDKIVKLFTGVEAFKIDTEKLKGDFEELFIWLLDAFQNIFANIGSLFVIGLLKGIEKLEAGISIPLDIAQLKSDLFLIGEGLFLALKWGFGKFLTTFVTELLQAFMDATNPWIVHLRNTLGTLFEMIEIMIKTLSLSNLRKTMKINIISRELGIARVQAKGMREDVAVRWLAKIGKTMDDIDKEINKRLSKMSMMELAGHFSVELGRNIGSSIKTARDIGAGGDPTIDRVGALAIQHFDPDKFENIGKNITSEAEAAFEEVLAKAAQRHKETTDNLVQKLEDLRKTIQKGMVDPIKSKFEQEKHAGQIRSALIDPEYLKAQRAIRWQFLRTKARFLAEHRASGADRESGREYYNPLLKKALERMHLRLERLREKHLGVLEEARERNRQRAEKLREEQMLAERAELWYKEMLEEKGFDLTKPEDEEGKAFARKQELNEAFNNGNLAFNIKKIAKGLDGISVLVAKISTVTDPKTPSRESSVLTEPVEMGTSIYKTGIEN